MRYLTSDFFARPLFDHKQHAVTPLALPLSKQQQQQQQNNINTHTTPR